MNLILKLIYLTIFFKNILSVNLRYKTNETIETNETEQIYFENLETILDEYITIDYPKYLYIRQGFEPTTMNIYWITKNETKTNLSYYILENLNQTKSLIQNISNIHNFSYPFVSNNISGYIHYVKLENLIPDTKYIFQFGDLEKSIISSSYFKTLSKKGFQSKPTVFGIIGSFIQTPEYKNTINQLSLDKQVQMILNIGDLFYGDNDLILNNLILNNLPWMSNSINYGIINNNTINDNNSSFNPSEKLQTEKYNYCPNIFQSELNTDGLFYSFENGLTHIVFLSSNINYSIGSEQYRWFIKDMESLDRKLTPWVIVILEESWYNCINIRENDTQTFLLRETFENLFYKYKVNLVFTSNTSLYERTYPVYYNEINSNAPIYIGITNVKNNKSHIFSNLNKPIWNANIEQKKNISGSESSFGYGLLSIMNSNEIQWKWFSNVENNFILQDNVIIYNSYFNKKYLRGKN
jgi:hypothetical protein